MHQITVPPSTRTLSSLRNLLGKAAVHCEARNLDPAVLVGFRLFPDMLPFASQVRIATDVPRLCVARLAGIEAPKFEDDETTLAALDARVERTLAFLTSVDPSRIDGTENKLITFKTGRGEFTREAIPYVQRYVLPNVYFHTVTAYNILRHNGVEIGKFDFLGDL